MALTKFDIASSALVMIGANPVSSFTSPITTEEIACNYLYQSTIDNLLSLYPWRFATRTSQMPRVSTPPDTLWSAAYVAPSGMRAIQNVRFDVHGGDIPFDRFENLVLCNASASQNVYAVHTYEPPIQWWPGYFVQLAELALAAKLAFALSAKLDLKVDIEKQFEPQFRFAKNADSRQQTSRKFKLTGRRSITEARLA